jgi:transposase
MAKQLNQVSRSQVVALLNLGFITREVAKIFKVNQSTVVKIRQKYLRFNTFEHLGGNRRHTVLSDSVRAVIKRENSKNPRKSLRTLKEEVREKAKKTLGRIQ